MSDLNKQFEEFAKLQAEFLKPLREANGLLADAFEKYLRLNYATLGDVANYSIDQTQLAASAEDVAGLWSKQYAKNKELSEKLTSRAAEGNELIKEFFSSLQKVEIAPMFEAPAKAAKASKAA